IDVEDKGPLLRLRATRSALVPRRELEKIEARLPRLIEGERQASARLGDDLLLQIDRIRVLPCRVSRDIVARLRLEKAANAAIVTGAVELDLQGRADRQIGLFSHTREKFLQLEHDDRVRGRRQAAAGPVIPGPAGTRQ